MAHLWQVEVCTKTGVTGHLSPSEINETEFGQKEEEGKLSPGAMNSWCHLRAENSREITQSGACELAGCRAKLS